MKSSPGMMAMESQGRPLGQVAWSLEAGESEALISEARNDGFQLDIGHITSHSHSEIREHCERVSEETVRNRSWVGRL